LWDVTPYNLVVLYKVIASNFGAKNGVILFFRHVVTVLQKGMSQKKVKFVILVFTTWLIKTIVYWDMTKCLLEISYKA
jgi:hypothetical protein